MKNAALERAIEVLGGPSETSYLLRVSYWTIREWRKAARVRDSRMAVLLAEAAQAAGAEDITVRELAGLGASPNGQPKGGTRAAQQRLSATSPDSPATKGPLSPAYPASPGTATAPATQALAA